jgi:hypothetical protein
MNKLIIVKTATVLMLYCFQVQARDLKSFDNKSEVNSILKLGLTPGGVEYEHKTSDNTSINFAINYNYKGLVNRDDYGFQITPEFRFYLSKNKNWAEGFYIGSYLFYKDYIVARDIELNGFGAYSRDDVKTAGIGLKSGYQFNMLDWISLDFGMGFGYNLYRDVLHKTGNNIINESTHHLNFTGGLAIGFKF